MRKTTFNRQAILTAAVLAGLSATHVGAASLYWDFDAGATPATGGAGLWTTPGSWRDGSATGTPGNWIDGSDAFLPNTAAVVTIDPGTPVAANSLTFANTTGSYSIEGGSLTVPTITLNSGGTAGNVSTSQRITSILNGPVTVVNANAGAGAAGSTTLSIAGPVVGSQNISTLTFGAGGTSFDKTNRIDLEAPAVDPDGDGQRRYRGYQNITNINFDSNFGMLSATLPTGIGGEIILNASVHTNVAGGYALIGAPLGSRFHFHGPIDGVGGIAIVSAPSTTTRATAQPGTGGVVFNRNDNTYAGPTRIMNQAQGILRSQVDNFLPKTTDLIFGGNGLTTVGSVNLNGMDVQIGSLSTEPGVTTFGIINNGAQALAEGRPDGADAIVTINGSNSPSFQHTTFAGEIGGTASSGLDRIGLVFAGPGAGTPGHLGSLTLTNAANRYAMGTTINSGAVISKNTANDFTYSPVGTGAVTVNGTSASVRGTFGGTGQVIGAVTINDFAHIAPGGVSSVDPSNPLWLLGGLTLAGGSSGDFELNGFGGDLINTTNLDVSTGTVNLNLIDLGSGVHNGTFRLIDYDTFAGNFANLTLVPPSGSTATFTLQQNNTDNAIDVLVSGAAGVITWVGNNGSAWDVNNTVNWSGPSKFFNGDFVTFDDTASTYTVDVAAGGVQPATMTVNAGNSYTFNGGAISASTLSKSNGGTLTFNNAATFSLGTTVSGGTLAIGPSGSISGGAISLTNATLGITAGSNIAGVPSVSLNTSILRADASTSTNRPLSFSGFGGWIDTNGNNLTISGQLSGSVKLTKMGAGTLTVNSAGSAYTGPVDIDAGTVVVNNVDANGITGLGTTGGPASATSALVVKTGSTFEIQNTRVGYVQSSGAVNTAAGLNLTLKTGSTLKFSGESGYAVGTGGQGIKFQNFISGTPSNINVDTGPAGSRLSVRNFVKNESAQSGANTTVHLLGDGILHLTSGSLGSGTGNLQYSGVWSLEMGSSGVLSVGPIIGANNTEVLNALGYQLQAQLGETRPVTVVSGTLAVGADERNPNNANTTTGVFRSPVTLSGGNIASTGKKYVGTAPNATASGGPVVAKYGANITLTDGTSSKVLLYEPVPLGNYTGTATPTANPAGSRSLRFVTEAGTGLAANFNWGNNTTLVVDSGAETGGVLSFERTAASGTVTVGTNATLQINAGGAVDLQGTADALSGGGNHVNVVNNSPTGGLKVSSTSPKNVGNVTGSGKTTVNAGASLTANHLRQGSATIDGTAKIRNAGPTGPAAGASNIGALTLGASGRLDLTNNKLITNNPVGTANSSTLVYDGISGDIQRAFNGGAWDQPGLTTSEADAINSRTSIGVASGEQLRGLGPTDTDVFAGQTITGASTVAMYTWVGDANLDGFVSADDYSAIDFAVGVPGASGWYNGDFNWDGFISADDYSAIDFMVVDQGAPFDTSGVAGSGSALSGVTAVPEPTSLGLIGLAAAGLLGRRRRRSGN